MGQRVISFREKNAGGGSYGSPYTPFVSLKTFFKYADGDPLGQFAIIQEDEGEWGLILKERLDREAKDRYTLKVTATDGKFDAPVVVDVHVLDINDNSPLCEQVRTLFHPSPT